MCFPFSTFGVILSPVISDRNSGCPFTWDNQNQLQTTTNDAEVVRRTTKGLHQSHSFEAYSALFVKMSWFLPSTVNVQVVLKQFSNLISNTQ